MISWNSLPAWCATCVWHVIVSRPLDGIPRCVGRLRGYEGAILDSQPFTNKSAENEKRGLSTYAAGPSRMLLLSWGGHWKVISSHYTNGR